MRLCFINNDDWPRTMVHGLAKHLLANGKHEITLVQPSRGSKFVEELYLKRTDHKIETITYSAFFFRNISYNVPNLINEIKVLSKLLSKKKYDIIQAYDQTYLSAIAPILLRKKYEIPIVLTTDNIAGYSWFYGDTFVDIAAKLYVYSVGKWMLNSYDRLIFLYTKALDEAEKLGTPKDRVRVIPNGVELEKFKLDLDIDNLRTNFSVGPDEKVLLFVGRLAKVKRVEILISLTKSLMKEGFKLKTLLVGDGPDRKFYEKLVRPIRSNVVFIGQVPRAEVAKYYSLADVLVLPSLSEGLPQVLLEASAAGKPCVATNVNGVSDIIVHGKTGYLVEKWNVGAYRDYVKSLLEDEQLSKKMGSMAAQHVKENFSWDTVVDKYEKMYEDIVNS